MHSAGATFITIATAWNPTQVINYRLLFSKAGIPFQTTNELTLSLVGILPLLNQHFCPVEFKVPAQFEEEARRLMEGAFEVHTDLPDACPACDSAPQPGHWDCPGCGLFLG